MRTRRLFRYLTAGTAGLAFLLASAGTARAASPTASGFDNWSCRPSAAHPQPVVLLHGLGGNGPGNFAALGPYLASAGFCVYAPTYGEAIPGLPVGGLTAIPVSAAQIAAFIGRVRAASGAARVDLVGHSEGGFQALYGPKLVPGEAATVARVVALAPPTAGTTVSSLVTIAGRLGILGAASAVLAAAGCAACTELTPGASAVASLHAGPVAQPGIAYTVIASTRDELVTPFGTEFVDEPGVVNETVQASCPGDPVGHIGLAYDPDVAELVASALDPGRPVPVTCTKGLPF
ncbi:MAG TPA: alpha/beta fold hydrolase [Trebonia sp.]|jgi:triacylglycerol esterase/lipase EstA (alpha/beta hydrolase family)|nr:alpha/beta fold hydrolase [Trebonia sp.]